MHIHVQNINYLGTPAYNIKLTTEVSEYVVQKSEFVLDQSVALLFIPQTFFNIQQSITYPLIAFQYD